MEEENNGYTEVSFKIPTKQWRDLEQLMTSNSLRSEDIIPAALAVLKTVLEQQLEGNEIIIAKKCTDDQGDEILVPQKDLTIIGRQPHIQPKENTD